MDSEKQQEIKETEAFFLLLWSKQVLLNLF